MDDRRVGPDAVLQMLGAMGPPGEGRERKLAGLRAVLGELTNPPDRAPEWWQDLWDQVMEGRL